MPTRLTLLPRICCFLLLIACPAAALDLKGRLVLVEDGKPKEDREARFAVVYFEPDEKVPAATLAAAIPAEPLTISMARKSFVPRVLAVPVGSRVSFPNDDRILHNAFSLAPGNRFDLGLYRQGEAKEAVMRQPGIIQVFCNVHHSMVAYVIALDTPFFAHPDADGTFELRGLPAGSGRLSVWHERAEVMSLPVKLPAPGPLEVKLKLSKPKIPPHRNKFGKPYKRSRGKAY